MREFAAEFYSSPAWKACRRAYAKSVGGLCEACLERGVYTPGEIVHHKIHLSPDNIDDPEITLSWSNLQLVCRDCHGRIHGKLEARQRYTVDECGRVLPR